MLDEREQRIATWAAFLGVALSIAVWAPAWDKGAAVALSGIGVLMSGLLLLAARRKSRLLTGGAALLLAFGPWGLAWLVGLPFLALSGWLLVRAPKGPRAPRRPRRAQKDDAGDTTEPPARPAGPPRASRRYTPPQRRR